VDDLGAPLALGFGLLGDGAHHGLVQINMLDLDVGDLDAPGVGLHVKHLLQSLVDLLALGQQLVEFVLAEDGAQGGLRQLRSGLHVILDLDDRELRVHHTSVDHRVDLDARRCHA